VWADGPAMPSPGDPQAEPTIGKAINGGFDLLEPKRYRCCRVFLVPLRALRQPPETQSGSSRRHYIARPAARAATTAGASVRTFSD
jgi:hypothetical protein